jgi:hypothetical protein
VISYKGVLAAGAAAALGLGSGLATNAFAQVAAGPPATSPGTPPVPGVGTTAPGPTTPQADTTQGNFRRDATLSVMQHPREGYEAQGIRAGAFLIFPQVSVQLQHDDNIYATATNETSDTIWRVQPQVVANSDWNRHALQAYARASFNRFTDHDTENTDDWAAGVNGRLDVSRATNVLGRVDYSRNTEPRTSANSPTGAVEPVQYDLWTLGLTGRHEFNRLLISGRIQSQDFSYDSPRNAANAIIDQSFRDRTVSLYGARADYAVSPKTAFFVDLQGEKHDYDHRAPAAASRNSDGYQALVGVNFELTNLLRGDVGVGYRKENFDDPAAKDLKGFSTNSQLEWFPTQLTTVTLNASRTIEDSAVPGAPGYLSTNLGARVDHELLRNVILTGRVGWGDDKYTGIVRQDRRKTASLGASYLINRNVGVSVTYDYNEQKTRKGVGNDFTDNRLGATLTVQY